MGSFTATKSYVIPTWAEHGGITMSGFDETSVPSTHYQSANGELIPIPEFIPPTQEVVPMDEITQNPFPIQKEKEPMKVIIRHKNGVLYEHNLSVFTTPFEQMSNMDIVLGRIKAMEILQFMDQNMNVLTNRDEYHGPNFNPRWETFLEVDDDLLDAKNLLTKFMEHVWQNENYNPGYMYSYRCVVQKIKQHGSKKGQGAIEIAEFLVSEMSGTKDDENAKHRLMIEFNTYTATTSGAHYQKKWPYALMITRTPDGLRNMWVRVRGKKGPKFIFGTTYSAMATKKLIPSTGRYSSDNILAARIQEYLQDTTRFQDWMPIAKYLESEPSDFFNTHNLHPFGIDMSMLHWIGGSTDVKAIVNKAYGKDGVVGVTKHMFGGRNNINSMAGLRVAIWFARALRDFPATVLNEVDLSSFNTSRINSFNPDTMRKFFATFGTKHSYLREFLCIEKNPMVSRFAAMSMIEDTMRTLKYIPTKRHRQAIVHHIKNNTMSIEEIHDYITIEYAKVERENKEIKGKKGSIYADFMAKQGHWINEKVQMVVPTHTHDLIEWGAVQNNCIGTYGDRVYSGETMIVGFKDTLGSWLGHAEIGSDRSLRQLLGKHNMSLESETRKSITKYLETELNIGIPTSYWGARDNDEDEPM